jgi:putative ABC transport system substrate-binding protein
MMSIGGSRWPQAGAFMSWGVLYSPLVERADQHVVKILRGAEPANLAVEEPTPFQFVVNLKTAKELGVTIP